MPDAVPLHATFDTVASLYDEVRPGYPAVIIDAVIERSGLPAEGRILEIGCGTGQITRPFARRGYAILALELGPSLAALAAEHLRPYPQVRVVYVAFEHWLIEREAFDLVLSAQAFHWIDPALGLARAAEVLKPQGAIALVWHLDRSEILTFTRRPSRFTNGSSPPTHSASTSTHWSSGRCATTMLCASRTPSQNL
jgi:SAM-dependent methyltransferase